MCLLPITYYGLYYYYFIIIVILLSAFTYFFLLLLSFLLLLNTIIMPPIRTVHHPRPVNDRKTPNTGKDLGVVYAAWFVAKAHEAPRRCDLGGETDHGLTTRGWRTHGGGRSTLASNDFDDEDLDLGCGSRRVRGCARLPLLLTGSSATFVTKGAGRSPEIPRLAPSLQTPIRGRGGVDDAAVVSEIHETSSSRCDGVAHLRLGGGGVKSSLTSFFCS